MKILAVECSAVAASAAVLSDGRIIASSYVNIKLTHSETLLPMIESMLKSAKLSLQEIDAFAVSAGPGSFTGVRIGVSIIKGLAAAEKKPCVAVSSLLGAAYNFCSFDCTVCVVMDARRNQFYNAVYAVKNGTVLPVCSERAISFDELYEYLKTLDTEKPIIIAGDGTDIFMSLSHGEFTAAEEPLRFQNACGIALAAEIVFEAGNAVTPDKLLPVYLRLPQAERELNEKKEKSK